MTKISNRLKAIVEFVSKEDRIVDVGCDHGLLSIYLVENKLVSKVIASDINQNALNSAINNIKKRNLDIETVLSDGIKDVDLKGINTLVISGMGTNTILHILGDASRLKNVKKLIIQSNNGYELLRSELNNKGYYLKDEVYTFDKAKWYITCCFVKNDMKNDIEVIKYGLLNNDLYNKYLLDSMKKVFNSIPLTSFKAKFICLFKIIDLKKAISKIKK